MRTETETVTRDKKSLKRDFWCDISGVDVTFGSAAAQCLLELAVSTVSTFGPNGMRKKEFYLSLAYPLHHPPRALLPWPAWWTLEARTRSLLALAVGLHPQRVQRPLCLVVVLSTVARRWTRRAVFGNFVTAMLTPEGNGALWSFSTH